MLISFFSHEIYVIGITHIVWIFKNTFHGFPGKLFLTIDKAYTTIIHCSYFICYEIK